MSIDCKECIPDTAMKLNSPSLKQTKWRGDQGH
jgi:hypothetical protein